MNTKEYYQKREDRIRKEWFPKHVATVEEHGPITILTWRNPDSSNYFCRYVIDYRIVAVYGDIGEAIYAAGEKLTLEWLARCDLDYFHGKCQASEHGREFNDWDQRVATEYLRGFIAANPKIGRKVNDLGALGCIYLRNEWEHWLAANASAVSHDFEILSELSKCGEVIAYRCQGHLVGIQMAVEQPRTLKP